MKIDINKLDLTSFKLKGGILNGQLVYLINPLEFNCKWTRKNLNLRSVLVDYDGNILSRGFNKFFNVGESPDLYPNPEKYKDWVLTNKEDGSLAICDYIFDCLNVRTRGTISYKDHENTVDFDYVIQKYNISSVVKKYNEYSILFEIYSPTNVIVLKPYTEPEIVLLGAIHKETGIYYPFYTQLGKEIQSHLNCKVPEIFNFSGNIIDIVDNIKLWKNKEGIVLNYNNSQNQLKIKSLWYLSLHRLKSELNNTEKVIDVWLDQGMPDYQTFYNYIVNTFDFELAEQIRGQISSIIDAKKEVDKIVGGMNNFVINRLKTLPNRKLQAEQVLSSYSVTNRSVMVFKLLDNKSLDKSDYKKLIFQILKN
jgi:T4 RnlA family RNA ligase